MVTFTARPPIAAASSGPGSLPARVTGPTRQNQSHNAHNSPAVAVRALAPTLGSSARSSTRTSAAPGAVVLSATDRVRKSIDRSHERRSLEQRSPEQGEPLEKVAEDPLERLAADLTALSLQHAAAVSSSAMLPPSTTPAPALKVQSAVQPAPRARQQHLSSRPLGVSTASAAHSTAATTAGSSVSTVPASETRRVDLGDTGLPAQLLALRDPACPVALPPPGGLPTSCLPLDNWKLDKLVLALSANKATWRRSLLLFEWLKASGHQLDDRLCTTLIRVCSDHGDAVSALAVYDWMTGSTSAGGAGLEATAYTYTAAMRAALAGGLTDRALSIWNEAWRRHSAGRLQVDCRLCITYLELCTRLGLTDAALAMYGAMRAAPAGSRMAPTVHAYTAAMRAATEGGRWYRALDIWSDMRTAGCEPTGHAYSAAISACAAAGDWRRAVSLFDEMTGPGAIRPDVVSCTALITALAAGGEADRAEAVVGWMLANGVRPNARTYTALMAALGNAKRWGRAVEVLSRMQSAEWGAVQPNAYTYSALLKSLGEHGQWQLAEAVFSSIERQVLGTAAGAPPAAALSLAAALVPTISPPITPLAALLAAQAAAVSVSALAAAPATASAGDPSSALPAGDCPPGSGPSQWTRPSQLNGLSLDLHTAMGSSGVSTTTDRAPSRRSFSLFSHPPATQLVDNGARSTTSTLTDSRGAATPAPTDPWRSALDHAAASVLAGQLSAMAAAAGAAAGTAPEGTDPLLSARSASMTLQVAPLTGLPAVPAPPLAFPNFPPHGHNTLHHEDGASAAALPPPPPPPSGHNASAPGHASHHSSSGPHSHPGGVLNEVVCGALMLAYERAGKWQEAVGVLLRALNLGIAPNTVMYNTAISAAGKAGQLEIAEKLYGKVRQPDTVTHETMIAAYGMAGLPDRAEAVFAAMTSAGCRPRDYAFCGLIAAHSLAGNWEGAMRVRSRMRRAGLQPSIDVYNALLAACERAGQPDRALELLGAMRREGVEANALTGQLLALVGRQGVRTVENQQVAAAALSAAVAAYGTLLMQTGLF